TAENVRHSVERQLAIQHQSNGWQLLSGIEEVETPDELTVTFHLAEPDATFPYILTTAAAAIVPMSYPADALQPNDQVIGSGPYTVESFDATQQIRLGVNESYAGDREVRNSGVILQFYQSESTLKQAIEEGEVMIAYRSLAVTDIEDLRNNGAERGVAVVVGEGTEINYLVLQAGRPPFDEVAVRQAVAQIIDRETIASAVYRDTVTPLYGPIPAGLAGHVPSFQERYGDPDPEAAAQLLEDAGGRLRPVVDARPLRRGDRRHVRRDRAPAGGDRPVRRHTRAALLGTVRRDVLRPEHGRLRPGLVPRPPGRVELHRPVLRLAEH